MLTLYPMDRGQHFTYQARSCLFLEGVVQENRTIGRVKPEIKFGHRSSKSWTTTKAPP